MLKKFIVVMLCCFISLSTYALGLTYRVMNGTSAVVYFDSNGWFDWGTTLYQGQTREHWYLFTPKNIGLTLYNSEGSRFSLSTSTGCDVIGLPPLREGGALNYQFKGQRVRMHSGQVDIVLTELPGSTYYNKKIGCSLIVSH